MLTLRLNRPLEGSAMQTTASQADILPRSNLRKAEPRFVPFLDLADTRHPIVS